MTLRELARFDRGAAFWFYRLLGATLIIVVATDVTNGVWDVHRGVLYPWRHLPIVPLYPPAVLLLEWGAIGGAGLALLFSGAGWRRGLFVRIAAVALFVSLSQRFANQRALVFLVTFFVSIAPPDTRDEPFDVARPSLALVRAQLVIVYVFSAVNKLAHGFGDGAAIANLLGVRADLAAVLAWGVLAAELLLPVLLWVWPRVGIAGVVLLHVAMAIALPGVWPFSAIMIAMSVLFVRPVSPSRGDVSHVSE